MATRVHRGDTGASLASAMAKASENLLETSQDSCVEFDKNAFKSLFSFSLVLIEPRTSC